MPSARAMILGLALAATISGLHPPAISAQTVTEFWFEPQVLPGNGGQPILLQVSLSARATSVLLQSGPGSVVTQPLALHDDGLNGDRLANDFIYSIQLPAAPILSAIRPDDVHRVFLGYIDLYTGTKQTEQINMYVEVSGSDIPPQPIVQLAPTVQATPHLVNLVDPAFFVAFDPSRAAKDFYAVMGDDYDFLALISSLGRTANRDHFLVRNDVMGDGQPLMDNTAAYGSAGRLQGISRFPIPDLFDGAETGFIHELGHQWINYLNFAPLASGVPHWPVSSMASGVMGVSIGGAGGEGGELSCNFQPGADGIFVGTPPTEGPVYDDFDLYLMGLIPPSQVRPQIVFSDQTNPPICNGLPAVGFMPITVDDIIGHVGPRLPAAGEAPARFKIANVLITRTPATADTMWLFDWLSARAELETKTPAHNGFVKRTDPPFFVATGGRGTLDTTIPVPAPEFSVATESATATVASGDSVTVPIDVAPTSSSFDGLITLGCDDLPAHATCTFSPPIVNPGSATVETQLAVSTRDPGTTPASRIRGNTVLLAWLLGSIGLAAASRRRRGRIAVLAAGVAAMMACGGPNPPSNGYVAPPNPVPTPVTPTPAPVTTVTAPGDYVIKVTGISGGVQQTSTVELTVH